MSAADRQSRIKSVFIVSSGNFLEMYDFMVFGYYATAIARTFFPSNSEYASLMLSLMTFGAGFLMRPLGAIFLGAYLDRHGRRSGLLLTLGLMAIGTMTIAFMPGYEAIGLLAPVLVLVGECDEGKKGFLRHLAVGEPASGGGVRRGDWLDRYVVCVQSRHADVGLAHTADYRMRLDSVHLRNPPLVDRDGRFPGAHASP